MKNILLLFTFLLTFTFVHSQPFPLVDIRDIQEVPMSSLQVGNDLSLLDGDTVEVEGVVTFNPCLYGLSSSGSRIGSWIQDPAENRWAGLHILIESGLLTGYTGSMSDLNNATLWYDNVVPGSRIKVTGIVTSFAGYTQLLLMPIAVQVISLGNNITPTTLPIDTFMMNDGTGNQIQQMESGEPYEGMLVQFDSVFVVDVNLNNGRWYWSVQDLQGNKIEMRDMSGHFRNDNNDDDCPVFNSGTTGTPNAWTPPTIGSYIQYVRGVLMQHQDRYQLGPRTPSDVGPVIAAKPLISEVKRDPVIASSTDPVTVSAKLFDPDGNIVDAKLYYSVGLNNTNFTAVNMTNTSGDIYAGTIPATGTNNAYVNYWIRAEDNDGDTTAFPSFSTSNIYQVKDNGINDIADIQQTPRISGASVWAGDSLATMNVHAVVTSTIRPHDLGWVAIQDGTGPWSGIILKKVPGDNLEKLNRGDSILITSARVIEDFSVTHLIDVKYTLLGATNIPSPVSGIDVDSIRLGSFAKAEAYEGMLVRFNNVAIIDTNADAAANNNFGEWSFHTNSSVMAGLRADDQSNAIAYGFNVDSLTPGMQLAYIQGILYYSFSNWKLLPRNKNDIAGFSTTYAPEISSFMFPALGVGCTIDDATSTINCTVPAGTNVSSLFPAVTYSGESLSPNNATNQDFTSSVTYTVTAPGNQTRSYDVIVDAGIGIAEKGISSLKIYPNPTKGFVNMSLAVPASDNTTITIYDVVGNKMNSQQVKLTAGSNNIVLDLGTLTNGMYFIEVKGEKTQFTSRINVLK